MRTVITTAKAPSAIGPYSQAIEANGFVFCSGQIPLSVKTGKMVDESIEAATEQAIENLLAVLAESGCRAEDVVKTTIYLASMDDFPTVNDVYGRYFMNMPPARACVEVARLPKDARIEIDAVAVKG